MTQKEPRVIRPNMDAGADRQRQAPRRPTPSVVAVRVGSYTGRLLDVSDVGMRFELDWPPDTEVPGTITVVIGDAGVAVPVRIVWTWHEVAKLRICGGMVAPDGVAEWRRFLSTL